MSRWIATVLGLLGALLIWQPALASDLTEKRFGLFVGNNLGTSKEQPLVWARSDAEKMRKLFVDYGQMQPENAVLLTEVPALKVKRTLESLRSRIHAAKAAGHSTVFVFYYSGHGDAQSLHLGLSRLPHEQVRSLLEATGADVRIALLDACQSGSALRRKGGSRGPSYAFAIQTEKTRGSAILTSSAQSELSQESDELGGGFFTHFLHSGLVGAADVNRDDRVTLPEAYDYVYRHTSFSTQTTSAQQTPGFDFDLSGSGDLVLTSLAEKQARLRFDGSLSGTLSVWNHSNQRYVAAVEGGRPSDLHLPSGTYTIQLRGTGWVSEAHYTLLDDSTTTVHARDFSTVPLDKATARGPLVKQKRKNALPNRMTYITAGVRGFNTRRVVSRQYLPLHAIGGGGVRLLVRKGLYIGGDILAGGGSGTLHFAELGEIPVYVQSASIAGEIGVRGQVPFFHGGAGFRGEVIGFNRRFIDRDLPQQSLITLAPGFSLWLGFSHQRTHINLEWHPQLLIANLDQQNSLPVVHELLWQVGYRF